MNAIAARRAFFGQVLSGVAVAAALVTGRNAVAQSVPNQATSIIKDLALGTLSVGEKVAAIAEKLTPVVGKLSEGGFELLKATFKAAEVIIQAAQETIRLASGDVVEGITFIWRTVSGLVKRSFIATQDLIK